MQYTHLGRTGLKVSRFCLGTMNFGLSKEALEQLDRIFPGPGGPAPEAYAW